MELTRSMMNDDDKRFMHPPFFLTEALATWTCSTCGEQKPKFSRSFDRWVRQSCPCQKEAKEREESEKRQREINEAMIKMTFRWLGENWSDIDLATKTFENFDIRYQPQGFAAAEIFADTLEGTLVLHGSFGTGKTHLLSAICNHLRKRGKGARFTTAPGLFGAIQECITYNRDYSEIIRMAASTPLLVIDDIDKAKWSEFREEKYFDIINSRTRRGLPTAISTNRVEDLHSFVGGAVASRFKIGQIPVLMDGKDYRTLL